MTPTIEEQIDFIRRGASDPSSPLYGSDLVPAIGDVCDWGEAMIVGAVGKEESPGVQMIAAERARQVEREGWTPEHDDTHTNGEMVMAATVYAAVSVKPEGALGVINAPEESPWPWDIEWFKPHERAPRDDPDYEHSFPQVDRILCLVKAGALIAAEIDRLERINEEGENDVV